MFSKNKITIAYTIEQCTKCGMIRKRKYVDGDTLFVNSTKWTSCDTLTRIEKIFSETIE